ncbi:microrchidia 6-like protein isoform X1, partial [Tanacetum coccineum]
CKQEWKTGCKCVKVSERSNDVKFGSRHRDKSPSEPTNGHEISISDSIKGHEVVADKQLSLVGCIYGIQNIGKRSSKVCIQHDRTKILQSMVHYRCNPMTFIFESLQPTSEENANSNLSVLLQWSPFSTEEELLKQDIRIMRDGESKTKDKSVKSVSENYIANHFRHSIRAYLSIFYLKLPETFCIRLPRKVVLYHNIETYLKCHEFISYKSHNNSIVEGELVVTIGFDKNAPNVKPFLSVVGLGKGRGIVGVFEANYIEPAHNKQDFENTNVYQKLVTRLRVMTYEYCCLEYDKVEKELNLKYQSLKSSIKHWLTEDNQKLNENHLIMLDKIIDQGSCNDDLIHERLNLLKEL